TLSELAALLDGQACVPEGPPAPTGAEIVISVELDAAHLAAEVEPAASDALGPAELPATLPDLLEADADWGLKPPAAPPAGAEMAFTTDPAFEAELREVFLAEAEEHLATINRAVLAIEADPADAAALGELRRAVHTLKGASGAVGLDAIADFCHVWEDTLDRVRPSVAEAEAPAAPELSLLMECTEALE